MKTLVLLKKALSRVAITPAELVEARRRRQLVADALIKEFGGRVYFNGALAHGDANDPLTDFDLGIVIPNREGRYGPGRRSASDLKARARAAIRRALAEEFPNLRVEVEGRKRSVLVRFSEPVSDRAVDFTGDVILAVEHHQRGLWIPRWEGWDRSDPELHTDLVLKGIAATDTALAWTNRLLKHWSCHHDRPLCSWHIKALTLDAVTEPVPLIDALEAFFQHAHTALGQGDTPDPAGVGPDIKARVSHAHARAKLEDGLNDIRAAKQAEADARPLRAQAHLASLLPDIVDPPAQQALADEDGTFELNRLRKTGTSAGVGAGAALSLPRVRAWRAP